jgi:hypothetical protein
VDGSVDIGLDAGEIAGKLVGKRCKKKSCRTAFHIPAREKECPRQPLSSSRLLCHFQTSHPFRYSERNSRLSDVRRAVPLNESTLV